MLTSRSRPPVVLASLWLCSLGMLAALVACGEDGAAGGSPATAQSPRTAPVGPLADAAAEASAGDALVVAGRLADDLDAPVVDRALVIVDRLDRRFERRTDGAGAFRVTGVAPPYDVAVAPGPARAANAPLLFLGVRRADPRFEIFEREGETIHPASQPVRVGVKLPPCPLEVGACWVSVVTASASGGGATAGSYTAGTESGAYLVEHSWRGAATLPGEVIDVHVLVGDSRYADYAYARVGGVPALPGEPTDVGMTSPLPVPSSDPILVAGRSPDVAADWQWTLATWLDLPGNATISLRYVWASATTMRVPRLPGATFRAGIWAQHPQAEDRPYFHLSSQAWTGTLPLTATDVAIDLPRVIETVRPAREGILSRRGVGLAWDGRTPALASLVVVDLARSAPLFRAFTSENEIAPRRLLALGIPRFDQGEHVLDLTTTPGATVDDLTQPNERVRRSRFDVRTRGAATVQRFRFQITP